VMTDGAWQRGGSRRDGGFQSADAGSTFPALAGIAAAEVIETLTGMRIQVQESLRLLLQALDQLQQRDVLVHVGEVAGMERVAVLHRARGRAGPWTWRVP